MTYYNRYKGAAKNPDSPYIFTPVKRPQTPEERLVEVERLLGGRYTPATLSDEQRAVFDQICSWYDAIYDKSANVLTLGGYAGTGKSTLVSVLAGHYAHERIAFCSYTGKATSVLRKKLRDANAPISGVSTLHALMYHPIVDEVTGVVRGWKQRKDVDYDLVIVDEASMLDKKLFDDLRRYNTPILAVGDHGQLPPVSGGGFNLMDKPELRLETIHRQAQDSRILALSAYARQYGAVHDVEDDPKNEVQVLELSQLDAAIQDTYGNKDAPCADIALLAYTNKTRAHLNTQARKARFGDTYTPTPQVGDQVICLRNTEATIFNGMRGIITELNPKLETVFHYYGKVVFADDEIMVEGPICKPQFGRLTTFRDFDEYELETNRRVTHWDAVGLLLDYGYALTVHKAQGSQFEHVLLAHSPYWQLDVKRALYTAVTRASKHLAVFQ